MFAQASVRQGNDGVRARGVAAENFPIASRLLSPHVRAAIMAFYRFARAADDVADDARLGVTEKLSLLAAFEAGLDGGPGSPEAMALRATLGPDASGIACARTLLAAFRIDAVGRHYVTWDDLRGYCALSADPVGWFLLDVHGEATEARAASDPLCTALQVLNHLQDIGEDFHRLGRVYLPADWMAPEGVDLADLGRDAATPALRRVIDRALDVSDGLLAAAAPLPGTLCNSGLRGQARTTLWLASSLSRALRRSDPLARRIAPARWRIAGAVARAALLRAAGR